MCILTLLGNEHIYCRSDGTLWRTCADELNDGCSQGRPPEDRTPDHPHNGHNPPGEGNGQAQEESPHHEHAGCQESLLGARPYPQPLHSMLKHSGACHAFHTIQVAVDGQVQEGGPHHEKASCKGCLLTAGSELAVLDGIAVIISTGCHPKMTFDASAVWQ